jgi:hypothetical protein
MAERRSCRPGGGERNLSIQGRLKPAVRCIEVIEALHHSRGWTTRLTRAPRPTSRVLPVRFPRGRADPGRSGIRGGSRAAARHGGGVPFASGSTDCPPSRPVRRRRTVRPQRRSGADRSIRKSTWYPGRTRRAERASRTRRVRRRARRCPMRLQPVALQAPSRAFGPEEAAQGLLSRGLGSFARFRLRSGLEPAPAARLSARSRMRWRQNGFAPCADDGRA